MADLNFSPNDPRYYTPPDIYPLMSMLLGSSYQPADEEEKKVYAANRDNLKAFLKAHILDKTDTPEQIQEIFGNIPGYNPQDPRRAARRQLSAQAREQLLKVALDYHISDESLKLKNRQYYLLIDRSDTPQAKQTNDNIAKIVKEGTPEEKGKLFEAVIKRCESWFRKAYTGFSDRELIENLKDIVIARDVIMNAENIRKMTEAGTIALSEETLALLREMEFNSPWINGFGDRIRAITNPTYEYIEPDKFLTLSYEDYEQLQDATDNQYTGMWDYLNAIGSVRKNETLIRTDIKMALTTSLEELTQANGGNFIGSRAYSQTLRSLRGVFQVFENMADDFPSAEELSRIKPMLQKALQTCSTYLENKSAKPLKNQREQTRFAAMKHTLENLQRSMDFYGMRDRLEEAETLNFQQPSVKQKYPTHATDTVSDKIQQVYGEKQPGGMRASDVGTAADELRADIYGNLNKLLSGKKTFDAELAGYIMSNMVVLEMVKRERTCDENKNIIAGLVERQLAKDPGTLIESVRADERLQSIVQGVNPTMLKHFIVSDGAKKLAESMTKNAVFRAEAQKQQPELQVQNKGPVINNT